MAFGPCWHLLLAETHVQPYCAHLDVDVVDDNDVVDHDAVDAVKPSDETPVQTYSAHFLSFNTVALRRTIN